MNLHINSPPLQLDSVEESEQPELDTLEYRKSPFIIQAACAGNIPILKQLLDAGSRIIEAGHICLSKKRKNSVVANVMGAAAYHGKNEMLKYLIAHPQLKVGYIDVGCLESQDIKPSKAGPF